VAGVRYSSGAGVARTEMAPFEDRVRPRILSLDRKRWRDGGENGKGGNPHTGSVIETAEPARESATTSGHERSWMKSAGLSRASNAGMASGAAPAPSP